MGHGFPVVDGIPDLMPEASLPDPAKLVNPAVDLTVLLLTWNEADNLPVLIPRINAVVERLGVKSEILVIDKGSADGTAQVAASLGARVARQTEPGFGGALRMGFGLARGRFICTMDADLSHEPEVLESMWKARQQAALVIGSRWVQGGGADMPLYRSTLSRILNRIYGLALHVPYHDMSSNCRLYRADVLRNLDPQGTNFDVLEDLLMRVVNHGHAITEVPLHHRHRHAGKSHVRLVAFALSYLRTLIRLRDLRHSPEAGDRELQAYHALNPIRRWLERRRARLLEAAAGGRTASLYVNCGSDPLLAMLPDATGVDSRLNRLRAARQHQRPVVRGSLAALPFDDGSYELVLWGQSQDGVADADHPLDELVRMVAPGGRLLVRALTAPQALATSLRQHGLTVEARWLSPGEWIVTADRIGAPPVPLIRPIPHPDRVRTIGLGTASITPAQRRYVNDVLDKNRLSYGEYTRRFEREFARLHDRTFAIFCNSGTSALQVAVHAMKEQFGWKDGDEILVPAITFVASSNVVLQNGMVPVFVDVEPDHFGIDPGQLQRHLTPRTRAVMPVHLFGQPCDMDPILAFARDHDLRMLEDSCETMFVRHKGRVTGSWGDVACFSTYVAHLMVTGVGGFATTNDVGLATLMKSLMNHGRDNIYLSIDDDDTDNADRLQQVVARRFSFVHVGYSYRATEMEAALGVGELEQHQAMLRRRAENAAYLTSRLRDLEDVLHLPGIRPETEHAFMMYPLVVRAGVDREPLIMHLEQAGVETRHLMPLINQPVYRRLFGDLEPQYPVAAHLNRTGFAIGCHQGLTRADLDYVADTFHAFFRGK
jgi:dTDP-4-amino-4,6-dideoxygalactose transaminase